jgi:hypothetical protein
MPILTNSDFIASLKPRNRVIKGFSGTLVAGRLHSTWLFASIPVAGVTQAANTALSFGRASQGALAPGAAAGGSNVFYLGISKLRAVQACDVDIYDRLVCQTVPNVTLTTAQTLIAQALPRFTTGDTVEMFLEVLTAMGAGTPTVTISYTNQAGIAGRTATTTLVTTLPVGALIPMTLQSGDTGVRSVETITLSVTATSGNLAVVLAKYIGTQPCAIANVSDAQDYAELGLPNLTTDPCLWLVINPTTTTSTNLVGHVNFNEFTP